MKKQIKEEICKCFLLLVLFCLLICNFISLIIMTSKLQEDINEKVITKVEVISETVVLKEVCWNDMFINYTSGKPEIVWERTNDCIYIKQEMKK